MTPFRFILLALLCYRAQRIVTTDEWPPTLWFREWLEKRDLAQHDKTMTGGAGFGRAAAWMHLHKFFTCAWCFGSLSTFGLVALDRWLWRFPAWFLAMGAAAAVVGLLSHTDS